MCVESNRGRTSRSFIMAVVLETADLAGMCLTRMHHCRKSSCSVVGRGPRAQSVLPLARHGLLW
jgi:hypothetical protein